MKKNSIISALMIILAIAGMLFVHWLFEKNYLNGFSSLLLTIIIFTFGFYGFKRIEKD